MHILAVGNLQLGNKQIPSFEVFHRVWEVPPRGSNVALQYVYGLVNHSCACDDYVLELLFSASLELPEHTYLDGFLSRWQCTCPKIGAISYRHLSHQTSVTKSLSRQM